MSCEFGQKLQKTAQQAYTSAAQFTGKPAFPGDHRADGSGFSGLNRLAVTQRIEMTYVAISATVESDNIALNPTVLPMLLSDMIRVKMTVKMTEYWHFARSREPRMLNIP